MKIAIVGPAHPYRGGIASFNERMALELQHTGHDVEVITFSMQYPDFLFPGKTQYTNEPIPPHLKISRRVSTLNPISWFKTSRYLKKQKFDVVVLRYWMPFFAPCLAAIAKFSGIKSVLFADNIIPHEKRIGDDQLTELICRNVDGYAVLSKAVQTDLNNLGIIKPCFYSPHPIFNQFGQRVSRSIALEKLKLNANHRYLLFFGFIRDYKGLDLLLDALKSIDDHVHLIIAGEFYGNEDQYQEQVRSNSLEDRCHFYDHFIPDDEVKYYFSASDALILPYKSATQSGVTQIGYHFEIPMLITNVGGLSEYVTHEEQGLVADTNVESIKESIINFLASDQRQYIERVKARKKEFTWARFTSKFEKFLSDL